MASGDITRTYAFIPKCIDYFLFFKVNNVKMTMNPDPDESAKHTRYYSSRAPDITVHSSVKRVWNRYYYSGQPRCSDVVSTSSIWQASIIHTVAVYPLHRGKIMRWIRVSEKKNPRPTLLTSPPLGEPFLLLFSYNNLEQSNFSKPCWRQLFSQTLSKWSIHVVRAIVLLLLADVMILLVFVFYTNSVNC